MVTFVLLLLFGSINVHVLMLSRTNSALVNYVGIVRGATQRLVKLELAGQPSDELIGYLDDIWVSLSTGGGKYELPTPEDEAYQADLNTLREMWAELKAQILAYRVGQTPHGDLLELSERYFVQANDTVFAADEYSVHQINRLVVDSCVMLGIIIFLFAFIAISFSRKAIMLEDSNKQLDDLAKRDMLTGTYRIETFKEKSQQLLAQQPNQKFAAVYTDFSDFRYINDIFGYDYGDSILAKYGEYLKAGKRKDEFVSRVSADNFVLLLRYTDKSEIAARQRAVDAQITEYMRRSRGGQYVATCCGICCREDAGEQCGIDQMLDLANFARKTAKNDLQNKYVYYDQSIHARARQEKEIEGKLPMAIANKELMVYYQPKVELATGKIACAEALVRWKMEDGSFLPPDEFIPLLERKFLIDKLDQFVFAEVCGWLRKKLDEGLAVPQVSVNVSRLQFYDADFVERYIEIRDRCHIPHELLEIELTESVVMDSNNLLYTILSKLRAAGFTCSIDDFGKGYSSLSMLKNLPIDTLKIDRFFFWEGADSEKDTILVESIIDLAKKFHIRTVAEGVERTDQVEHLKKIGCDYVQGFVFYRPMPAAEYEKLLS